MTRIIQLTFIVFVFVFWTSLAAAQRGPSPQDQAKRGGVLFNQTCATAYCHGANGVAGGAPQLAGRGLDASYIQRVVTYGISGTAMPAWGQLLPGGDLSAVIAYVESLNGLTAPASAPAAGALPPEAAHGRDLFYDSSAELGRCSNCHQVNGRGNDIARIKTIPSDAAALRNMAVPDVVTATVGSEKFPALMQSQTPEATRLYDLTAVKPVLLTVAPASVKLTQGSSWQHSVVLGKDYPNIYGKNYSDDDLNAILGFLRAEHQP